MRLVFRGFSDGRTTYSNHLISGWKADEEHEVEDAVASKIVRDFADHGPVFNGKPTPAFREVRPEAAPEKPAKAAKKPKSEAPTEEPKADETEPKEE